MNTPLLAFLITMGVITLLPGWLTGNIIRKYADRVGAGATDWIPFSLLPYAIREFKHPNKFAILWGYVFCNLLFTGTAIAIVIVVVNRQPG